MPEVSGERRRSRCNAEIDDGIWSIYFGRVRLARLDERDYIIRG